jgi:hypothetical protein
MARMSEEDWKLARLDYETYQLSFGDIAKKYGVGKTTIADRAKKEGWQKGKNEQLAEIKAFVDNELEKLDAENRTAVREMANIKRKVLAGTEYGADIYYRLMKAAHSKTLDIEAGKAKLDDIMGVMRLLQMGTEAMKTPLKVIEISEKQQPEIIESDQPKTLKLEVVRVEN